MPVGANPGPRADDRPPEWDPQPRRARRSRAGDTMTSSSAQLCRGCVGGPRLTAAHRKHLGRSSRPARIALSGRGRRELRIERRDSAVFRSGGRPVYRKAGRLTPPSSVEVGVVGRSHHRFYWSNHVLMQRLATLNATVGPTYFVAWRISLAAAAGTTIQPRLPSRSTASVSRIATPAASADLCQASSIPPGLCVDSGPKAIRRLSRAERSSGPPPPGPSGTEGWGPAGPRGGSH